MITCSRCPLKDGATSPVSVDDTAEVKKDQGSNEATSPVSVDDTNEVIKDQGSNEATSPVSVDDTNEVIKDQGSNGLTSVQHLALDTGLRFKMPSQQKKNADLLLQEMFADELEEDDIGPKDLEDLDELDESEDIIEAQSNRRLTFHTVDAE